MFTTYCQHCKNAILIPRYPPSSQVICLMCHKSTRLEPLRRYYPRLVMIKGDQVNQDFLVEGEMTIGRGGGNTIPLTERKASRRHASIKYANGQYLIADLDSGNGTFVNNRPIKQAVLRDKDIIKIAEAEFIFRNVYQYTPENEVMIPTNINTSANSAPTRPIVLPSKREAVLTEKPSELAHTHAVLKFNAQHSFLMSAQELQNISEVEKANNKLRILYKVNHAISSILNLQELLTVILDVVFQYIPGVERGAILLYDETSQSLRSAVTKVRNQDNDEQIQISRTILERVMAEKISLLTTDASIDERLAESMSIITQGIRSAMSVPLISKEDLLGVLHIDSTKKSDEFNQDNLELLTGIASQAAIAIENAKLIEEVQRETETRNHLQRYLSPELVDQVVHKKMTLEIGGQLKKATILFSDLRGFTKMTENIGAEAVVAILNDYFSRMVDIIFATGGTLDKFIGDAIMAIWGIPIAHPEDSMHAVKASLQMECELFYFNLYQRRVGRNVLKAGIGINVGQVVVGNMGSPKRMEYTVIGPPVNMASRVETLTSRNQILISDNVYSEIKDIVRVVELAPTRVKGIERLIQIYAVVGIHDPKEHNDITFIPILIPSKQSPDKKYDGLLHFFDSTNFILHVEPNDDFQIGETNTFSIDLPDIAPTDDVQFVCEKRDIAKRNQDEFLLISAKIVSLPDTVQKFLNKVMPPQNFEQTITCT